MHVDVCQGVLLHQPVGALQLPQQPQRCRGHLLFDPLQVGEDAWARSWPAIQSASATGAAFGTGSAKDATCRTTAIWRLTGSGIAHAPATGSIEPTCMSGISTKGKPSGSKIEVVRRAGWKLRPDRTSSSRAGLGEHVYQHAAVRPATDLLSGLVDETFGPMSHLGSI